MQTLRTIGRVIVNMLLVPVWLAAFVWVSVVALLNPRHDK